MNKKIYKLLFLMITLIILFICPKSVYATTPVGTETTDNPYAELEDLGGVHIQTDVNNNVSIKEIDEIQGDTNAVSNAWNFTFEKYRGVIAGICGVCTLTFVLIFLVTFVKIANSTSNPHQRAELTKALIWIGLGAAGFGSVTVILSLGFGLFKG